MALSKNPRPQIRIPVHQSALNRIPTDISGVNANNELSPSGMPEKSTERTRETEGKEEWASIDLNSPAPNPPNSPESTNPKPHQENRRQARNASDDNSSCPCSGCQRVEMLYAGARRSVNKWPSTLEEWLRGVREARSEAPVEEGVENKESAHVSDDDDDDDDDADYLRRP